MSEILYFLSFRFPNFYRLTLFWLDDSTLWSICENWVKKKLLGRERLHRWGGHQQWGELGGVKRVLADTTCTPQVQPSRWDGICRVGLWDWGGGQWLSTSSEKFVQFQIRRKLSQEPVATAMPSSVTPKQLTLLSWPASTPGGERK